MVANSHAVLGNAVRKLPLALPVHEAGASVQGSQAQLGNQRKPSSNDWHHLIATYEPAQQT